MRIVTLRPAEHCEILEPRLGFAGHDGVTGGLPAELARHTAMRWTVTKSFVLLGIIVASAFTAMFATEVRDWYPAVLKPLLLPGMAPFFVVGTITESGGLALASFWLGTLLVYGSAGLICDALVAIWRNRRPQLPGDQFSRDQRPV